MRLQKMAKDGPPSSSTGYRYGGRAAFESGLPSSTIKPRKDPEARQALADFSAYPSRVKSIGTPLPTTKGVSPHRARALSRATDLASMRAEAKPVLIEREPDWELWMCCPDNRATYFFSREGSCRAARAHIDKIRIASALTSSA